MVNKIKKSENTVTVHFPANKRSKLRLLRHVAVATGHSPSEFVLTLVERHLQKCGLVDSDGAMVKAKVGEFITALPPLMQAQATKELVDDVQSP